MHVPDVTDVNGGRMKAERFPCLTEDLISLFGVFGRKAESRRIFKSCNISGNDGDYSFDLYLSRFAEHVCSTSHSHPDNESASWELLGAKCLAQGHLDHCNQAKESMCRMQATPSG